MTSAGQTPLPLRRLGDDDRSPRWLGLATTHRRLFDALQGEWLNPPRTGAGTLLGVERYVTEPSVPPTGGHPISVRLKLNATKLPALEVRVFRRQAWMTSRLDALEPSDAALHWPGALPAFANAGLTVSNEQERAQLVGLARGVSNVELPAGVPVVVDNRRDDDFKPDDPPVDATCAFTLPDDEDAIRGAMTMAMWAVPRIDPWLDLLAASLAVDRTGLPERANVVSAPWWRFPPWARGPDTPRPSGPQECLWLAAIDVFIHRLTTDRPHPGELAERIADRASSFEHAGTRQAVSAWLHATHRILRAEKGIQPENGRMRPVELAIQLVLNRPDPGRFKTWFTDLPGLPPAVAWSAAALCGLLHGNRRLETSFRGGALQRELLAIHAMRVSNRAIRNVAWPSVKASAPAWRRDGDAFVLSWDGRDFSRKTGKARGRWYAADFSDGDVLNAARALAGKRDWSCSLREVTIEEGEVALSGRGEVEVRSQPVRRLAVRGCVRMRLPENAVVDDILDVEAFRRAVAIEAGPLPDPPARRRRSRKAQVDPDVPGLSYLPDFISPEEEKRLTEKIAAHEWRRDLKRNTQHYGWRYDYSARQVDSSMRLGPLPDWADCIGRRLVAEGLLSAPPDQLIVNEYKEDQGISRHVDSPGFADGIVTISLLESWEMVFRHQRGAQKRKVSKRLEQRSAMILTGAARYDWTHEIPARRNEIDPSTGKRWKRGRRISLTFRRVLAAENDTTAGRRTPTNDRSQTSADLPGRRRHR